MKINNVYTVFWGQDAEKKLLSLLRYKVKVKSAYMKSLTRLCNRPHEQWDGIVNYPGFEFNGYYWVLINNVIMLYRVIDETNKVYIDACFYANTGLSHEIFWGISQDDE